MKPFSFAEVVSRLIGPAGEVAVEEGAGDRSDGSFGVLDGVGKRRR